MEKLDKDSAYNIMTQHFKQNPFYNFDIHSINWAMIQQDQQFEEFVKTLKLDEITESKILNSFKDHEECGFFGEDKETINKNIYLFKYGICFTLINPEDKQIQFEKKSLMERFLSSSTNNDGYFDFMKFLKKVWTVAYFLTVVNLHFVLIKLFVKEDQERLLFIDEKQVNFGEHEFYLKELTDGFDDAYQEIFKGYTIEHVLMTYFRTVISLFGEEAKKASSKLDENFFERFMDFDSSFESNSNDEENKLAESYFPKLKLDESLKEKIVLNANFIWSSDLIFRSFVEFEKGNVLN